MDNDIRNNPFLKDVPEVDGYKLLDSCVLYALIGKGGMGAVYLGRYTRFEIDVAVKCLRAAHDDRLVHRFQREGKLAARLNNPNVVRIFDVNSNYDLHYMIMAFVKRENARERVARKGGALSAGEAVAISLQASRGLAAAHAKGVVHRDVKPDNILIATDGDVKITDLGLGCMHDGQSKLTISDVVMGTPAYMPPEQWNGLTNADARADVWAVGATLYFLLAGRDAFGGERKTHIMLRICTEPFPDIRDTIPGLPEDLVGVLARCTARSPEDRFADCGALVGVLEKVTERHGLKGSLRDVGSGTGTVRCEMVSPPPSDVMTKARTLETIEAPLRSSRMETPPMPDTAPGAASGTASQRGGGWKPEVLGSVAALALGVFLAWRKETTTSQPPAAVAQSARAERDREGSVQHSTPEERSSRQPLPVSRSGEREAGSDHAEKNAAGGEVESEPESDAEPNAALEPEPEPTPPQTVDVARPEPPAPEIAGFRHLTKSAQDFHEYEHRRSGLVMALLPGGVCSLGSDAAERWHVAELIGRQLRDPAVIRFLKANVAAEGLRRSAFVKPFLMSKYEVTQKQWPRVSESNPSRLKKDGLPVDNVSWRDCMEYCRKTSLALPTETEWEYACRASSTTAFAFGTTASAETINVNGHSPYGATTEVFRGRPVAVDDLAPNQFGLHNMHGNAQEWCADPFIDDRGLAETDPTVLRACRGGSWASFSWSARSAARRGYLPVRPHPHAGLRPVYRP